MGWHLKAYLQGVLAAKRLGIPVMVRGDSQLETPRSRLKSAFKVLAYPWFLRLFDAALYVGERSRTYYGHYGYPADRLFFSPHCVDTAWFGARATDEERQRLRALWNRAGDYRLALFRKAPPVQAPCRSCHCRGECRARTLRAEVIVAGSGELERASRAQHSSGVPLHLLGFRNQTEMPAAYAAADCLVLPSEHETWGLVANEALACGRPIIVSSSCGCAPDLARDGNVGRTFPTGNPEALADAIGDLATSPVPPLPLRRCHGSTASRLQ